ncbi:MAG: glycosyl hydrolase family 28-related protein [Saprospiraceae bacterium]
MKIFPLLVLVLLVSNLLSGQNEAQYFPDGSRIPPWFFDTKKVKLEDLGKQYPITDFGVKNDSTLVQTWMIQRAIDVASEKGGGVIVIPKGVYLTGALFFKPNTHLHLEDGAKLKGSDNISDYPKMASRMEGQNLDYYPALINVYNVQGFTLSGNGTIDGNGLNFWKAFWQRREENPDCTNLEVARPRLLFFGTAGMYRCRM